MSVHDLSAAWSERKQQPTTLPGLFAESLRKCPAPRCPTPSSPPDRSHKTALAQRQGAKTKVSFECGESPNREKVSRSQLRVQRHNHRSFCTESVYHLTVGVSAGSIAQSTYTSNKRACVSAAFARRCAPDRKSTRLNSSH